MPSSRDERRGHPERTREAELIAPSSLRDENRRSAARRRRHQEGLDNHEGILEVKCSDAREKDRDIPMVELLLDPEDIPSVLSIDSIAASIPPESFQASIQNKGISGIVVRNHFRCGGAEAFEAWVQGYADHLPSDLLQYMPNIRSSDPAQRGILTGSAITMVTDMPVLVTVSDYKTLRQYPIAVLEKIEGEFHTVSLIPPHVMHDPKLIYQNGYPPSFTPERIVEKYPMFAKYMQYHTVVEEAVRKERTFEELQVVQDPNSLIIKTDSTSSSVLFERFRKPNTAFEIYLPIHEDDNGDIEVRDGDLEMVRAQASFPLSQALMAERNGDQFHSLNNVIILAPRLDIAMHTWEYLWNTSEHLNPWAFQSRQRRVIVGEMTAGELVRAHTIF